MAYFGLFKDDKKEGNKGMIIFLLILFLIFLLKKIIESGYIRYTIMFLILLIGFGMFYDRLEKWKKSRPARLGLEFSKKYPVITQYGPPKGINPAEAGLLYNLRVDPTDLTSLVYQWKFEGLIDVVTVVGKNSGKEYIKLIKKNEIPLARPIFETEIFDSIFVMGNVKIIEGAFQLRYALMLEDLEFHGIKKGWVVKRASSVGGKIFYELLVSVLFLCVLLYFTEFMSIYPKFGLFVLGLLFVCIIFGGYIGGGSGLKFTDKGAKLASQLIGYRNFIKSCDENKIRLILKDDPLFVDRTLPYATAFGLETWFLSKISPLRTEWSAKYANGKKVLPGIGFLRFLFKSDDDSF